MRKDIEWLKEQILILQEKYTIKRDIPGPGNRRYYNGMLNSISLILDSINELDEPEVLSQELPVIPKYVAEYVELAKSDVTLMRVMELANTRYELPRWEREYNWISKNSETFAKAWLDGFTIASEEEETWKPVENYEELYEVSNKGNVRSLDRNVQYKKTDFTMKIKGIDLKPNVLKKGYLQVTLSKSGKPKSMLVHRLVMNAFNPTTDDNLQVNHIDGNKENNEFSNLEWVTAMENTNHAYDIGLRDDTIGNNRKLTEDEVLEIIDLYETGNFTQKELGNKYNVGRNTIGEILLGKTWGWLTGITNEIENEQKFYVDLDTAAYVAKWNGNDQVDIYTDGISGSDEFEFHLTEEEIKSYDERFWPFAVKVEELTD